MVELLGWRQNKCVRHGQGHKSSIHRTQRFGLQSFYIGIKIESTRLWKVAVHTSVLSHKVSGLQKSIWDANHRR